MSHATSLRISSTVLTAAIVVCSFPALVVAVRSVTERLHSSEPVAEFSAPVEKKPLQTRVNPNTNALRERPAVRHETRPSESTAPFSNNRVAVQDRIAGSVAPARETSRLENASPLILPVPRPVLEPERVPTVQPEQAAEIAEPTEQSVIAFEAARDDANNSQTFGDEEPAGARAGTGETAIVPDLIAGSSDDDSVVMLFPDDLVSDAETAQVVERPMAQSEQPDLVAGEMDSSTTDSPAPVAVKSAIVIEHSYRFPTTVVAEETVVAATDEPEVTAVLTDEPEMPQAAVFDQQQEIADIPEASTMTVAETADSVTADSMPSGFGPIGSGAPDTAPSVMILSDATSEAQPAMKSDSIAVVQPESAYLPPESYASADEQIVQDSAEHTAIADLAIDPAVDVGAEQSELEGVPNPQTPSAFSSSLSRAAERLKLWVPGVPTESRRPEWMDDSGDWYERQEDSMSSAARGLASRAARVAERLKTQRSGAPPQQPHAQRQKPTTPQHNSRQNSNIASDISQSLRSLDAPDWFGNVQDSLAKQNEKSAHLMHRVRSTIRFASRPRTLD